MAKKGQKTSNGLQNTVQKTKTMSNMNPTNTRGWSTDPTNTRGWSTDPIKNRGYWNLSLL